jgi:hypothetical protein
MKAAGILLGLAMTAGCVGAIGGGEKAGGAGQGDEPGTGAGAGTGTGAGTGAGTNTGTGTGTGTGDANSAGVMPLRRLTAREYDNTVRDLLGDKTAPGQDFPSDRDPGFGYHRPGVVSPLESERLRDAAEALASAAVANFATLMPCTPAAPAEEGACAQKFAEQFGLRAYRRPLLKAEVDRLLALYQSGREQLALPFKDSIGLMLEGMLQSSAFLYRWELGPQAPLKEGNLLRLGPYEIASRLSYFLWSTMPDKELFDAAGAGKLNTAADVEGQVRRMVKDPRAREGVGQFFEEWLDIEQVTERSKDAQLYPEWNDDLKAAMVAETRAFVAEVLFGGDARLSTILTAPYSMVDAALARLYGASNVQGTTLQKVNLEASQRAGVLTHGSFLAVTGSPEGSNPVTRGRAIYLHLLCKDLPAPPPDVPAPMPASAGGTTRDRFEAHAKQDCARSCHQLFEPFGYAFENYDGIGRFRTRDNDLPVNATATVTIDGAQKSFSNARELAKLLSDSAEAQRCFANQWLRFAFRRGEGDADMASVTSAVGRFAGASLDIRELLVGLASSRTFRYRSPNPGEVLP